MSTTRTHAEPEAKAETSTARGIAAAAAVVFAIGLFWTVAAVDVPHEPTDSELLAWWGDSSNRMAGLVSGISAIVAACSLAVVMGHLQTLSRAARSPRWLSFARSMGAAVTALWLVTGAARAAVSHLVDVMNEPLPGVDVLRMATALNYTLLGLSGMSVLGLCIIGVSGVILRTGALARWVGYVGIGCSVVMLGAVVAQYGGFATPLGILWGLCLAVGIWRQPSET